MTAKEFMLENLQSMDMQEVENCLIDFAKYHCEQQQIAIIENTSSYIDESMILESYPLDLIN